MWQYEATLHLSVVGGLVGAHAVDYTIHQRVTVIFAMVTVLDHTSRCSCAGRA